MPDAFTWSASMPDAEVCFCFRGIMGEIYHCERHGGGVAAAATRWPEDAFEPHPVVLWPDSRVGSRPPRNPQ